MTRSFLLGSGRYLSRVGALSICWGLLVGEYANAQNELKIRNTPKFTLEDLQTVDDLPKIPPGLNKEYALAQEPTQSVNAFYAFNVGARDLAATEWVAFAPYPVRLGTQNIREISTDPSGEVQYDLEPDARPVMRIHIQVKEPKVPSQFNLRQTIHADLYAVALWPPDQIRDRRDIEDLSLSLRTRFLRPTTLYDYTAKTFPRWIERRQLARGADEGEVDYASRVFDEIVHSCSLTVARNLDLRASKVCDSLRSDSFGVCALFIATLRSQGIPTRMRVGRFVDSKSAKDPGPIVQKVSNLRFALPQRGRAHAKADFFAQGVGWVPVDPASAIERDPTEAKKLFFGWDPGDFLTYHLDHDLKVDSLLYGEQVVPSLSSGVFWVTGAGSLRNRSFSESRTFQPLEPAASPE